MAAKPRQLTRFGHAWPHQVGHEAGAVPSILVPCAGSWTFPKDPSAHIEQGFLECRHPQTAVVGHACARQILAGLLVSTPPSHPWSRWDHHLHPKIQGLSFQNWQFPKKRGPFLSVSLQYSIQNIGINFGAPYLRKPPNIQVSTIIA